MLSTVKTSAGLATPELAAAISVATLSQSANARSISAFGDTFTFLLEGSTTGGRLTSGVNTTPPGGGPPIHYHLNEDEWFLVLEGRATFYVNKEWTEVAPGGMVYVSKGVVHTFRNVGLTPLKMLISMSPSGFETFFARCEAEFARSAMPDMAKLMNIAGEHGIHFVPECEA